MRTMRKRSQLCTRTANQEDQVIRVAAARKMHDEMASRAADTKSHEVVPKVFSSMTREEIIATILGRA